MATKKKAPTKRSPRQRKPAATDVLSATRAAVSSAEGSGDPKQAARAQVLLKLAEAMAGADHRELPKLATEWRAAFSDFVDNEADEGGFAEELREEL